MPTTFEVLAYISSKKGTFASCIMIIVIYLVEISIQTTHIASMSYELSYNTHDKLFSIRQLVGLWDKYLIHQYNRVEFFESLQKIESADKVFELLSQEVSRLQELYVKCAANRCRVP
ncbi:hypothetical protein Glove_168g173 [Diversispora epigaea]|uniref:Uncharacterized protein n=1 Tax=Diversispora epigaea TaxID=1348612 RepID=A0A397IVW1_9GLOM|nr:hypothetical protein Glove_168g173 [Diversispora epigaea]